MLSTKRVPLTKRRGTAVYRNHRAKRREKFRRNLEGVVPKAVALVLVATLIMLPTLIAVYTSNAKIFAVDSVYAGEVQSNESPKNVTENNVGRELSSSRTAGATKALEDAMRVGMMQAEYPNGPVAGVVEHLSVMVKEASDEQAVEQQKKEEAAKRAAEEAERAAAEEEERQKELEAAYADVSESDVILTGNVLYAEAGIYKMLAERRKNPMPKGEAVRGILLVGCVIKNRADLNYDGSIPGVIYAEGQYSGRTKQKVAENALEANESAETVEFYYDAARAILAGDVDNFAVENGCPYWTHVPENVYYQDGVPHGSGTYTTVGSGDWINYFCYL